MFERPRFIAGSKALHLVLDVRRALFNFALLRAALVFYSVFHVFNVSGLTRALSSQARPARGPHLEPRIGAATHRQKAPTLGRNISGPLARALVKLLRLPPGQRDVQG